MPTFTMAQMAVASNAFDLSQFGKTKVGMDSVMLTAFFNELEKVGAELSTTGRKHIKGSNFVFPKEKKYPIHDESHARNALARVAQHGTEAQKAAVRAAVHKKYPHIGEQSKEAMYDPVGEAKGFAHIVSATHAAKKARMAAAATAPAKSMIHTVASPARQAMSGAARAAANPVGNTVNTAAHGAARAVKPAASAPVQASNLRRNLAIGGAVGGAAMVGHMMPQHQQQQPQQRF